MNPIQPIIQQIENTFSKDDLKSAPRKVLEDLILSVYDELNKINGTYPDWWDREN